MTVFQRYKVDWFGLCVVLGINLVTIAYLMDARSVSANIQNLLLVQPVAIVIFILTLFVLPQCIKKTQDETADEEDTQGTSGAERIKVIITATALLLYAFCYQYIGFDVASYLFCLVTCLVCGERRLVVLLIFPLAAAVGITLAAGLLIPSPVPTLLM